MCNRRSWSCPAAGREIGGGRRIDLRRRLLRADALRRPCSTIPPPSEYWRRRSSGSSGQWRLGSASVAIAARIVCRGVVAEAICQRPRRGSRPSPLARPLDRGAHDTRGPRLRRCRRLAFRECPRRLPFAPSVSATLCLPPRYRDRPRVVADDEDDRKAPDTGEIHCLGDIAFRGRPVAENADGDPRFAPQLERERDARPHAAHGCRPARRWGSPARGPAKSLPRSSPPQ